MKDLTHYFSSPPKSEVADALAVPMNNQNTTGSEIVAEEEAIDGENGTETEKETPRKKRSRVKIKISVHGSRTRRCDIIDNAEDVIDKTPSPFTSNRRSHGTSRYSVSDTECTASLDRRENSDDGSPRKETTNAFEVMMTRGKAPRYKILQTPSPCEAEAALEKSKKYKNTLKERKHKLIALADQKGYSKRKHTDLEEAELIERRLEKRAKLFRRDGEDKRERDMDNRELQGKNYAVGNDVSQRTPKSKAKWTMKVKLQSRSDDEIVTVDGDLSDEDHIFTPKSKVKFASKTGMQKSSEDKRSEAAERHIRKKIKKPDETLDQRALKHNSATFGERESKDLSYRKQKTKKKKESDTENDTRQNPVEESMSNAGDINDERISIESLDGIIVEENPRSASAVKKLAPLFVKKSKPNSATTEARRSFLQSGIPKRVKKTASEQKSCLNEVGYSSMPFPCISHVSQLQNESDSEASSGETGCTFYKRKLECGTSTVSLDTGDSKSISDLRVTVANVPEKTNLEKFVRVEKANVDDVLREIESRYSNARIMWTNVSSTSNRTSKKSPKKRNKQLQRKSNAPETEDNLNSPNPTWTCKYKPTNSTEILGNEAAIGRLRSWLSGWKSTSPNGDYSSGDEFDSSDGGGSSYCENNQVAVLLGPHGSGKTASVYAIAEELEYRVLEVNASSRRTGKKLLTDFQEATKSHRVKRNQKTLSTVKKKPMEKKVPQNSLILIEDVDIIFDEDEGFVSATCQLAANTRRPIVMTCKEPCPHLNKMAPRQQLIQFQAVSGSEVSALLELISLAESGYRLPKSYLNILLRSGDLRQSLLQLQYILQSGPPNISQLFPNARANLWLEARYFLYKPAVKRSKKCGKECADEKSVAEENAKVVNELAAKLECMILISSLTEVENPTPPPWERKLNPSLSLVQDFQPYSNCDNLSSEIADWLTCATLTKDRNFTNPASFDAEAHLSTKRNVKLGIDLALAQAVSSTLEHRSKSTDYLPVIRTICRTEEERARINTKRSKRFHNYLHGLNVASTSSNILAAASSVFQDKFP